MQPDQIKLELDGGLRISGLFMKPENAKAMFVFAHGAGAGMTHTFMEDVAHGLAVRGIATLRFNFPFMEARAGKRWGRPDTAAIAHAALRAALIEARMLTSDLPLFAGGKSYGARMTSQMQGQEAFPRVRGLVFVGFPLHAAKKPSLVRAEHLSRVCEPMLFVQGARDALAEISLIRSVCASLEGATLHVIEGADHGFHVLARSGRKNADVIAEICSAIDEWIDKH
ncbi:MAG: alpha/beta hydrolase [Beijerinckiaceae bacterium]|nr:alpha/beta hydrolase [Beijerinckiaceae bacterium]